MKQGGKNEKFLIFGHRGAPAEAPENTMASFKRALEAGADFIEMDLRRTADGRAVVIHDRSLNRTTSGRGRVDGLGEDGLVCLDAGSWFGRGFEGERIPTLDAVLSWAVQNDAYLDIELKDPEIEEFTVRRMQAHQAVERVVLSSWNLKWLHRAREIDPLVRIAPIMMAIRKIELVKELKPEFLLLWSGPLLTTSLVRHAGAAGIPVIAWLVNSRPLLQRVISRGVRGVVTDEIGILKKYVSENTITD